MRASEPNFGRLSLVQESDDQVRLSLTLPRPKQRQCGGRIAACSEAQDAPHLSNAIISDVFNNCRSGRGKLPDETKFTNYARNMVRRGCGAIRRVYGKKVSFLTVTVPGGTPAVFEMLARFSSDITDRLKKWCDRQAPGCTWVYVWELQKRGALHLHAAIAHEDPLKRRAIEQNVRDFVYNLFVHLSDKTGVDWFQRRDGGSWRGFRKVLRVNAMPVRKDVVRYMAKYLTKQAGAELAYSPARWWGMSDAVRCWIAAFRRSTSLQSEHWELLKGITRAARAALEESGRSFQTWHTPVSYEEVTLSIYPENPESIDWYEVLALLVCNRVTEERQAPNAVRVSRLAW